MSAPSALTASHAMRRRGGSRWVLAGVHCAAPLVVMVAALLVNSPVAMIGAALVLIAASIGYAPLARRFPWAVEHVIDLWAMAIVMIACASADPRVASSMSSQHHPGAMHMAAAGPSPTLWVGVLASALWLSLRVVCLLRSRSVLTSAGSGIVCASGLVWMLLLMP